MKSHEVLLHRRHCGSNEIREVNHKGWGSPGIIIQNKGTLQNPRERYTQLIFILRFPFCEGLGRPRRKVNESAYRM